MTIASAVQESGQKIIAAAPAALEAALREGIQKCLVWPYQVTAASVRDEMGKESERFAAVIHVAAGADQNEGKIAADATAAVIDAMETLTLENLHASYSRIVSTKRLAKSPPPKLDVASTTITLGVIFAQKSEVGMEELAEELQRLNAATSSDEWPDMVAVASTGALQYAVQFPGESLSADFLPPAKGALDRYTPTMYVVLTVRPTGELTFNKVMAYVVAHLAIFSPGSKLPVFTEVSAGVSKTTVVITGYQYALDGQLRPVPPELYQDRYFSAPPLRIADNKDNTVASVQFVPWQDGGAVILRGKLPLARVLQFIEIPGRHAVGVINRPDDLQISHALPMTKADFNAMLGRLQKYTDLVVKPPESNFVVQKVADEGSASPFIARLYIGMLRLRDVVYSDSAREQFDNAFDFVPTSLTDARASAREIAQLWAMHAQRVSSGQVVSRQGSVTRIEEGIDKELRKQLEHFLNSLARSFKQGMQNLTDELDVDIGFMYQKPPAFERGVSAMAAVDAPLGAYLRDARTWSDPFMKRRNDLEHTSWTLPRITYDLSRAPAEAIEPEIDGRPVTDYVRFMLDRVCCFVEEVTAHCLQARMPASVTITEIPLDQRRAELPERFALTFSAGGRPRWTLTYHVELFERT